MQCKPVIRKDDVGWIASATDEELNLHVDGSSLTGMKATHVDDFKLAGTLKVIGQAIKALEAKFGKLNILWDSFTNTGIRHSVGRWWHEHGSRRVHQEHAHRAAHEPQES